MALPCWTALALASDTPYDIRISRIRGYLSSLRVTALGWLIISIGVVAAGIAIAGPRSAQIAALAVSILTFTAIVFGGSGMLKRGRWSTSGSFNVSQRQSDFHAVDRDAKLLQQPVEADEAAWRRERERREHDGRS